MVMGGEWPRPVEGVKAEGRLMEHGAQETSGSKQAGQCQGQSLSITGATVEPFFFLMLLLFFLPNNSSK